MIRIKDIFALLARLGAPARKSYLRPANRLEAAVLKRRRKAEKLQRDTLESATNNWAHGTGVRGQHLAALPAGNLNPFYIAK